MARCGEVERTMTAAPRTSHHARFEGLAMPVGRMETVGAFAEAAFHPREKPIGASSV
jgi:hypothetical protein